MDAEALRDRLQAAVADFNAAFGDPARRQAYLDFYAPGVRLHGYPPGVEDAASLGAFYGSFWDALADGRLEIEETVVEGDRIAARFRLRGTHTRGPLLGVAPAGAELDVVGLTLLHVDESGLVVQRWQALDNVTLLAQLGASPPG